MKCGHLLCVNPEHMTEKGNAIIHSKIAALLARHDLDDETRRALEQLQMKGK